MEPSAHRYAVAVMLPEPVANRIRSLQREHNLPPWEPRIEPHITLVSPFTTDQTTDDLAARLAPVALGRHPYPIQLNGFGRFDSEESVIFVRVVSNIELTKLANRCFTALEDLRKPRTHPFIPHATLAAAAPRGVVDEYFRHLADDRIALSFACDRFSLLELDEVAGEWRVVRDFPFA